jgi:predicted ATPase
MLIITVPVIFDRGIPDMIGYASLFEIDRGPSQRAAGRYCYNKMIFVTPDWKEIYATDDERKMSFGKACEFGREIKKYIVV